MKELNNEELKTINGGGFDISGSILNAITNGMKTILEIGRSLGTAIRRSSTRGGICSI